MKSSNEKIAEIRSAYESGMNIKSIDPIGNGSSFRVILKGGRPTDKKIDEMYANALKYREEMMALAKLKLEMNPETNNRQEKEQAILTAVKCGIAKSKLDAKSKGYSITRLEKGAALKPKTIDRIYKELVKIFLFDSTDTSSQGQTPVNSTERKIKALEVMVSSLLAQVTSQQQEIRRQQEKINSLEKKYTSSNTSKKTRKIAGITVLIKKDKIRGVYHSRWYGSCKDQQGKRIFIYIGKDLSKAKEKIVAGLQKRGIQI